MRKMLLGVVAAAVLAGAVCTVAGAAPSQPPTIRLSWDQCDPLVFNKDFGSNAPATIYTMVVSGVGFEGTYQGGEMRLVLADYDYASTAIADAWHFEAGGCNTDQLTSSTAAFSKACPKLEGLRPLPLFQYDFNFPGAEALPNSGFLQWFTAFDPFDAVAATRYTVVQFKFDHAFSVAGPSDPNVACGNADKPMCVVLRRYGYLNDQNVVVDTDVSYDNKVLSWNDSANPGGRCPLTPSRPSTWGQIKASYRQ
jgi:hypothetical protein